MCGAVLHSWLENFFLGFFLVTTGFGAARLRVIPKFGIDIKRIMLLVVVHVKYLFTNAPQTRGCLYTYQTPPGLQRGIA